MTVNDPLLIEAAAAAQLAPDHVEKETERELRELFASVVPAGAPAWVPAPQFAIHAGEPADEILKCAAERAADLIVMGTQGLSGYRKMFFGSITERVLRQTSIAVLAVPLTDHAIVTLSEQPPVIKLGVVMAPVDLGPSSEKQARTAAELAQRFSASLLVVHVLAGARTGSRLQQTVSAREQEQLEAARGRLAHLAPDAGAAIAVDTHIAHGQPAEEIAKLATQRDVGLIVIGLTGEGATAARPGSVAYRVLTLAPVPVLALP
jgi:nucleotide-binding universal stress UspA family protein